MYDWDFSVILRHKWVFVDGALISLKITLFVILFGTAAGLAFGLARSSKRRWISVPSGVFVEIFLALPIIVLLIWIYYCGPILFGINLSGFWTAVLALSLTLTAFVAEIVRSSLHAVPSGHVEAARGLGMSGMQTLGYIVLPQAFRVMLPPLMSMYIDTLKMSSLASVIAVYELLHSAQNLIMDSYQPLEIYTAVAVIYLIIILPFALLARRYEASKQWRLL